MSEDVVITERRRRDAERYRWLKERLFADTIVDVCEGYVLYNVIGGAPSEQEFDEYIDRQIEEEA